MRHELLDANPMDRIDTVKVPKRLPRPAAAGDVTKVLAAICPRRPRKDLPLDRLRDRVLFETIYVCGARAGKPRSRRGSVFKRRKGVNFRASLTKAESEIFLMSP